MVVDATEGSWVSGMSAIAAVIIYVLMLTLEWCLPWALSVAGMMQGPGVNRPGTLDAMEKRVARLAVTAINDSRLGTESNASARFHMSRMRDQTRSSFSREAEYPRGHSGEED